MTRTGTSEARFPNLFGNLSGARYFLELAIIAATYFGIAETALLLPAINATATPLWPPTGLALSLILLRNDRIWPAILIGSIFASAISSSPTASLESASSAIATPVAALAGAWLINHWSQGYNTLASPLNVARFALISSVPTAVISSGIAIAAPVDTSGRITSWSSTAQKVIGYKMDEIVGEHFGVLYRPDERRAGEPNRAIELAIQKGKHEVEGWRVRKNGEPFYVTGVLTAIRDDDQKLIGANSSRWHKKWRRLAN